MINFYHGLIGNHVHFAATMAQLGAQCGVCHNPDLPYLSRDYADLVEGARRQSILPSVRVGNSIGCRVALQLAGPDDQLVLTAPPFDYGRGMVPLTKGAEADWVAGLYVQKGHIQGEAAIAAHAADQIRGLLQSRAQIRRLRNYKAFAQSFWLDPNVQAAQGRLTFVIGDADFTTPVDAFCDFVHRTLPRASVEAWKDCGHAVPLDAPRRLAALIRHRWLRLKMAESAFARAG